MNELATQLQAPFAEEEIEWRAQRSGTGKKGPWCMVLAYVSNRAIQNRLDEAFGPMGWRNEYKEWHGTSQLCGISVFDGVTGWVTKWDGADVTDIEGTKGGLSGAMKRCAVQWGIGRYLYNLETSFAQCCTDRPPASEKALWRQGKVNGSVFYWKTPQLPNWALPSA